LKSPAPLNLFLEVTIASAAAEICEQSWKKKKKNSLISISATSSFYGLTYPFVTDPYAIVQKKHYVTIEKQQFFLPPLL